MPLKKSKDKKEKEKEKELKAKEKGKEAKKDAKKDAKKMDKGGSKGKAPPPSQQQLAQAEMNARQRALAEPPPDVTLQMQKVRVLPAIPPECTCGRHDTHQHQRQQQSRAGRDSSQGRSGNTTQGRTSSAQASQRHGNLTYSTVQIPRGSDNYATVQQARTQQAAYATVEETRAAMAKANYATVQEARAAQGSGTYATAQEARAAGVYVSAQELRAARDTKTYASVQEVRAAQAAANYATIQEMRAEQSSSNYATVKEARASQGSDTYATVQQVRAGQGNETYSTVQQARAAQANDNYATVKEARAAAAAQKETYVSSQQARAALGTSTYATAQQVRAAKTAQQAQTITEQPKSTNTNSNLTPANPARAGNGNQATANQTKQDNGRSSNGNGRGPPILQPLSQRRTEEQKSKGGSGPHEGLHAELGEGSEDEMGDGGFLRGGRLRSSLPVVRSPNKTLEKPLGLVFLIYRNETKRALLPNEVTSMDTVRALFVRSFPDQLSMAYLDSPKRKIYVLDQGTNVYYELEILKDVKDRAVLKIYETDVPQPQAVSRSPSRSPKVVRESRGQYFPVGQEGSGPHSPAHHAAIPPRNFTDQVKAASLPAQSTYVYQQQVAQYGTAPQQYQQVPPGGQPLSPSHQMYINKIPSNQSSPSRAHPMSQNSPTHYYINRDVVYSNHSSPSHTSPVTPLGVIPNQRHSVAYLPDGTAGYPPDARMPQSRSYHDYYDGSSRSGSTTPTASDQENTETQSGFGSSNRMDKMEAQLANLAAWVQTAVVQRDGSRPGSARSNASLTSDTSAKSKSENATPVQSPSTPPVTGLSDVSSATPTPQPVVTVEMHSSIRALNSRAKELKFELRNLRRMQLANAESMRETLQQTFLKIKEVLSTVPGAHDAPVRTARSKVDVHIRNYNDDARRVEQDLIDLETAVEELRTDVLNKRCRVQSGEVESMALALSNISKALADLKGKYPHLADQMKTVMASEMEVVVKEERYLHDQPQRLDGALKRCKKLTGTLFTMKRLASVQEEKIPAPVNVAMGPDPGSTEKRMILENIQSVVPDHKARLQSLEAADASRERKKKITVNQEAMRFEKSLELAQKQLRETNNIAELEQRQEKLLNGLIKQELVGGKDPLVAPTDGAKKGSVSSKLVPKGSVQKDGPVVKPIGTAGGHKGNRQNGPKSPEPEGQNPPQKPPRTMLHESTPPQSKEQGGNTERGPETVSVKSTANIIVSSEGGHYAARPVPQPPITAASMSTFAGPNGRSLVQTPPSRLHEIGSTGKPPMPPPQCTSTPMATGNGNSKNVTFSPSVTEIGDTSPDQKNKKVPPPPPPRRSSRSSLRVQSPQSTPTRRGTSPPAYENIENFPTKVDPSENGASGGHPPPGMVLISHGRSRSEPAPDGAPGRPPGRGRPLNKFQQELAEGIYANLNRPDLQSQHVNAAKVIHDPSVKEETAIRLELSGGGNSDNESTTSSADSQSGTIRRNPKASGVNGKDGVTMREGKKVPPPPPVRRSSHLSKTPEVETVKEENERPKSVHELQQQFTQMEQQQKVIPSQRLTLPQPALPVPVTSTNTNGNPVWQKQTPQNTVNGSQHKQIPSGVTLVMQKQPVPPPSANGDVKMGQDQQPSVQSIVTKFSTTQTLNAQTSKVVIQRQSVKKCEETEIF